MVQLPDFTPLYRGLSDIGEGIGDAFDMASKNKKLKAERMRREINAGELDDVPEVKRAYIDGETSLTQARNQADRIRTDRAAAEAAEREKKALKGLTQGEPGAMDELLMAGGVEPATYLANKRNLETQNQYTQELQDKRLPTIREDLQTRYGDFLDQQEIDDLALASVTTTGNPHKPPETRLKLIQDKLKESVDAMTDSKDRNTRGKITSYWLENLGVPLESLPVAAQVHLQAYELDGGQENLNGFLREAKVTDDERTSAREKLTKLDAGMKDLIYRLWEARQADETKSVMAVVKGELRQKYNTDDPKKLKDKHNVTQDEIDLMTKMEYGRRKNSFVEGTYQDILFDIGIQAEAEGDDDTVRNVKIQLYTSKIFSLRELLDNIERSIKMNAEGSLGASIRLPSMTEMRNAILRGQP